MTVQAGEQVWVRVTVAEVFGERFMIEELHCHDGEHLPHSDVLPAVARWLAMYGAETLVDLINAGVFCFDEGGRIFLDDSSRRDRLIKAGRELIAAIMGGEGAGG